MVDIDEMVQRIMASSLRDRERAQPSLRPPSRSPAYKRTGHLRGEGHKMSKLTSDAVWEILALTDEGELGQREIAKMFGISTRQVYNVITGRAWRPVYDRYHAESQNGD